MRGHDRAMRVARTLADLDGSERVGRDHVAQAVAYRSEETAAVSVAAIA
jgi:magnesium chelatase family protein